MLGEEPLSKLRNNYENLQLLIMDEVSMVHRNLLNHISCRLDQIKRTTSPETSFGNISVLAVGDFYQIPPAQGRMLTHHDHGQIVDLWQQFHKYTLVDIMRQRDSAKFAELLNRLRVRPKNQNISQSDQNILNQRLLLSHNSNKDFEDILHIYSTNKSVDKHNKTMLEKLKT